MSRLSDVGQMASALAHELNQPLAAIVNYVQAMRRLLQASNLPPSARIIETMDKTVAQAARAGEIIQHLRGFIRKGESERHSEDLNKVVEEATALGLVGAKESGIKVRVDLSPAAMPVFIDKVQIQQVVFNLIRNSVEALPEFDLRELSVSTRRGDRPGAGRGQRHRPRPGAEGHRAAVSAVRDDQGEGDGPGPVDLPLHHRGAWRPAVGDAEPGQGRHLPIHPPDGRAWRCPTMKIEGPVYVVDDDDAVRDSLALLLEAAGLRVEAFAGAAEVLARCRDDAAGLRHHRRAHARDGWPGAAAAIWPSCMRSCR